MSKELIVFNEEGNQVISSEKSGGSEIQTVKYGIIKLIGDKTEYKVSFKTLLEIEKYKTSGFTGSIKIKELHMSVAANQIVMAKSEVGKRIITENFTKLPTTNVLLDENLQLSDKPRSYFKKNQYKHYYATVHYRENNGEKQLLLEKDKIKHLIEIVYENDYEIIASVHNYGLLQEL